MVTPWELFGENYYEHVRLVPTGDLVKYPYSTLSGCIQVLTTSFISSTYCSLPTYCKRAMYTTVKSYWFSEVGLCIGTSDDTVITKYKDQFGFTHTDINTNGWCVVSNVQMDTIPKPFDPIIGDVWYEPLNYTTAMVVISCGPDHYVTYKEYLNYLLVLDSHARIIVPKLRQTEDSRWCTPYYINGKIPHITGPTNVVNAIAKNNMLYDTNAVTPLSQFDPIYVHEGSYAIRDIDSDGVTNFQLVNDPDGVNFRCDAYKQTSNMLPLGISSISYTIVSALVNAIEYVATLLLGLIPSIVWRYIIWLLTAFVLALFRTKNIWCSVTAVIVLALYLIRRDLV